jgi:arylsulfatase A-like enzyme
VTEQANPRPNIVLIVLDTLRADSAALTSDRTRMPRLASIAEQGQVYSHAVSNSMWTYPSHASIFTGLLPSEHRMEAPGRWVGDKREVIRSLGRTRGPKTEPSLGARWLPAMLARAGYEAVCASNNPWVGRLTQMDHGFTRIRDTMVLARDRFDIDVLVKGLKLPRRMRPRARAAYATYEAFRGGGDMSGQRAIDAVKAWAATRDASRPYFLFVNLLEAHAPYLTPLSRRALWSERAGPLRVYEAMSLLRQRRQLAINLGDGDGALGRPAAVLRALQQQAATYLDHIVGELWDLARSDPRGVVFCVTSDHGESFGEHGALFHISSMYEPALHVPLVLVGDGVPAGVREDTVDGRRVYATLVSAAGVDAPRNGVPSLLDRSPHDAVSEREAIPLPPRAAPFTQRTEEQRGRMRVVIRDPWKLMSTSVGPRVFHLDDDPGETTDVSTEHPDIVRSLEEALPAWPQPEETAQATAGEPRGVTAEEEREIAKQLEALGYIE